MINLTDWIRRAGKEQQVGEFQCPYITEAFIRVSYASKFTLNQIREASREIVSNPRTREREERLNEQKLRKAYSENIIKGWRGVNAVKLRRLLPGLDVLPDDEEKEIPFDSSMAEALLEVSAEFENWIIDIASNIENFSFVAKKKEEEYKNLA